MPIPTTNIDENTERDLAEREYRDYMNTLVLENFPPPVFNHDRFQVFDGEPKEEDFNLNKAEGYTKVL